MITPMIIPVAVFLFSLFILLTGVTSEPNDVQRNALLEFISNVYHPPTLSWNSSESVCSWKGVVCNPDNTTVIYLRLPAFSLTGEIPPGTIGKLTDLRVLSLRYNGLNGTIPSDFADLSYLTRLWLSNNKFSGQLPYINSPHLTSFNVSYNMLNTSIPSTLSKFPKDAFMPNVFACGKPFSEPCNSSYPSLITESNRPTYDFEQHETSKEKRKIVGVSMGTVPLLLILLSSVGKKVYQQIKKPSSKAGLETKNNKQLVLFDDEFELEDLLSTSGEVLGEGNFGTSYKHVLVGKKTVVVKRLKDVMVTEKEFRESMEVLGRMKNKNLVPLKGFYNFSKDEKWVLYDYMPAGSLSAHLHGSKLSGPTQLNMDSRMKIALDAARGIEYLHVLGKVVHGNIKSSNILLGQETGNEASVSDYGLNTLYGWSSPLNNGYRAPEVHEDKKVTPESDVYSFGVLLLELLTGEAPKQATLGERSKWVESIVSEKPKVEMFDMEQLWRIAKDCVSIVPDQRPSMHDVVTMMEDMRLRRQMTTQRDMILHLQRTPEIHLVPARRNPV